MKRENMFRIVFWAALLAAALPFAFAQEAELQSVKSIWTPLPPDSPAFGSNQYYSVVFDGEGEAAVAAKLVIVNTAKSNLTALNVEIPGNVRIIAAVQEVQFKQRQCNNWERVCTNLSGETCTEY